MINLCEPISYQEASKAKRNKVVNGCGSAKAKFDFVPDTIYGLCITPACNIHDWMYHLAPPDIIFKREADRVFLNNVLRIIEDNGGLLKWFRKRRALKYYLSVKYFGGPAFWNGKN